MPKMNGLQLLEHIKKQEWQFPVLILSNVEDKNIINKAKSLGAKEYLVMKTIAMPQLWKIIEKYLSEVTQ